MNRAKLFISASREAAHQHVDPKVLPALVRQNEEFGDRRQEVARIGSDVLLLEARIMELEGQTRRELFFPSLLRSRMGVRFHGSTFSRFRRTS